MNIFEKMLKKGWVFLSKSPFVQLTCLILWGGNVGLILCACHSGRDVQLVLKDGSRRTLPYSRTFSTVIASEPPSLDWLKSSDADSSWIQEHLMNGLVRFDLSQPGLKLKPALATHWEQREGGRVWRFFLRKNVYWSDGVLFEAKHLRDAFKRILDPQLAAIAVNNIFLIKGALDYYQGRLSDFKDVGVGVIDPWTVEFELKQPVAFFPMLLTHHTTFPVRMDLIKKYGNSWTEPGFLVGLGPYKLIHWHHDSHLVLESYDNHWEGEPPIKYIVFYMIEKDATRLRMFERGKLDLIKDLPSSEIPRLRKKPEFHSLPGLRLYYYGFKVGKKPFDDKRVRQALAMAIDREELVKVLGGGQSVLKNWVPRGMFGFDSLVGLDFNVKRARELLRQAGYEVSVDGDSLTAGGMKFIGKFSKPKKTPPIVIGFNTDEKHRKVAENIQAQLKKNLGLQVELKNEEWKTFLSGLQSQSAYSLFRLGWVADYPDPHNFMDIMTGLSPNNRTDWVHGEYDKLVQKALGESDPEKRLQLYHRAQKILVEEDVPVIPLFCDVNQVLVSGRVKNYHNNVLDLYLIYTMDLKH